ncbi:hypothetical protein PILCRDRAFT_337402 [Piloderma croceum F 1598]|uniref:Uncharacterized protein n=1 Tax=Piloderma croceum (strain F 1598) TaxID=765440 RepID=A0A0C3BGY2_PILCF|nr:hypothetical protein PILCRDRAFT_337402 [Piloderma croceum F 1598]
MLFILWLFFTLRTSDDLLTTYIRALYFCLVSVGRLSICICSYLTKNIMSGCGWPPDAILPCGATVGPSSSTGGYHVFCACFVGSTLTTYM